MRAEVDAASISLFRHRHWPEALPYREAILLDELPAPHTVCARIHWAGERSERMKEGLRECGPIRIVDVSPRKGNGAEVLVRNQHGARWKLRLPAFDDQVAKNLRAKALCLDLFLAEAKGKLIGVLVSRIPGDNIAVSGDAARP